VGDLLAKHFWTAASQLPSTVDVEPPSSKQMAMHGPPYLSCLPAARCYYTAVLNTTNVSLAARRATTVPATASNSRNLRGAGGLVVAIRALRGVGGLVVAIRALP
jgi:hypothetical protein